MKMSKYRIPVGIQAVASTGIGVVECDSLEEFNEKADELWKSQDYDAPSINCTNDFDLNDWDITEIDEDDLRFFVIEESKK
jgi:hypothetical protein